MQGKGLVPTLPSRSIVKHRKVLLFLLHMARVCLRIVGLLLFYHKVWTKLAFRHYDVLLAHLYRQHNIRITTFLKELAKTVRTVREKEVTEEIEYSNSSRTTIDKPSTKDQLEFRLFRSVPIVLNIT